MLFFKECKKVLFSLTFIIYIAAVLGFYFTQFAADCKESIEMPREGMSDYGVIPKEIPEILMPGAARGLVSDYMKGSYTAYPMGFYKEVKLSDKKREKIIDIITEITGLSKEELEYFRKKNEDDVTIQPDGGGGYDAVYNELDIPDFTVPETVTYERFRELMKKADKIIGGGTNYSDDNIVELFSTVPRTYEDALAEYNDFFEKDKVTKAYARLFCDYIGIIVAILPVFAAASLANADKKAHMEQLIYARSISSRKVVFTRYTALVTVLAAPVMILSIAATISVKKLYPDADIDILAIPRMAAGWLLPNIMLASAVGMALTELTSPLLAVFANGTWWASSIMSGGLTGGIKKFTLVCRHNSLFEISDFADRFGTFAFNRIFYGVFALLLMILTVCIFSLKRKGEFYAVVKHTAGKSKA